MDSVMVSRIEKAIRYAQERDRFEFQQLVVKVRGDNRTHTVSYDKGDWTCSCGSFASRGMCSHTIAIEKLLGQALPNAIPMVMSNR